MRLPRRVGWASLAELDQLCTWIYSDNPSQLQAINRLSAWRAITPLPHALESTLALLSAVHQDEQGDASPTLNLRQSYATALVRMVNGLVDPLQLGAYARPIASIAAQIGLPSWLVELRHAATHEDLPSLQLLRTAARDSLSWLLHKYFLPTLTASTRSDPSLHLPPLSPILKQYKSLLKRTTRDTSLKSRHKQDSLKILRAVERWLGEASVAAAAAAFSGWGASANAAYPEGEHNATEPDEKERWALDRLCAALLERGGLVPVSPKKRTVSTSTFAPSNALLAIWEPLLASLRANHPSFPAILVSHMLSALLPHARPPPNALGGAGAGDVDVGESEGGAARDASYDVCLASWAAWLVDAAADPSGTDASAEDVLRREDVVAALITGLGTSASAEHRGAEALLKALCQQHPHLRDVASTLLPVAQSHRTGTWADVDTGVMEERLDALLSAFNNPPRSLAEAVREASAMSLDDNDGDDEGNDVLPAGWRLVNDSSAWKPCPIGVYIEG